MFFCPKEDATQAIFNIDEFLADYRQLRTVAKELERLYGLLDARMHQMTHCTIRVEAHFTELFKKLNHTDEPLRENFMKQVQLAARDD